MSAPPSSRGETPRRWARVLRGWGRAARLARDERVRRAAGGGGRRGGCGGARRGVPHPRRRGTSPVRSRYARGERQGAAALAFGGWRAEVQRRGARRPAARTSAAAAENAARLAEFERAVQEAQHDAVRLAERLRACEQTLAAESEGRRAAEAEVVSLRTQLEQSEKTAAHEAARAQKSEEAAKAMEEELRAAEYKQLLEQEAASQQAQNIHMQLSDIMPKSPFPRGRTARFAAEVEEEGADE